MDRKVTLNISIDQERYSKPTLVLKCIEIPKARRSTQIQGFGYLNYKPTFEKTISWSFYDSVCVRWFVSWCHLFAWIKSGLKSRLKSCLKYCNPSNFQRYWHSLSISALTLWVASTSCTRYAALLRLEKRRTYKCCPPTNGHMSEQNSKPFWPFDTLRLTP